MGLAGNSIKKQLITNGAMASTNTITSDPMNVEDLARASIQFVWTGTPNGTFSVQASNNYDASNPNAATWTDLTLSSSITAAGSASSAMVNLTDVGFSFLRAKYVNSSSTGTLQCYAVGKAV